MMHQPHSVQAAYLKDCPSCGSTQSRQVTLKPCKQSTMAHIMSCLSVALPSVRLPYLPILYPIPIISPVSIFVEVYLTTSVSVLDAFNQNQLISTIRTLSLSARTMDTYSAIYLPRKRKTCATCTSDSLSQYQSRLKSASTMLKTAPFMSAKQLSK